ncbi:hypothetical protein [Paludisphaera soli]|uniref:hypothetical protein n=1 Tax=Paludisphaera soli TaxID=2712865 RepID=UPI0013EDABCE|nr:hypothetical protein [Paludisphaera soli]
MTRTRFGTFSLAAIAWLAASATASAGFLGSTITSQYYAYGSKSGAGTTFTADGQAHARFANYFDVIATDSQIIYEYRSPVVWSASAASLNQDGLYIENGNLLTFADAPSIIGVAINAATNVSRFSAANVTFHEGALAVNWARLSFTSGSRIVLDLTAAPPVVAEPPALALMLGGLACAAGAHRSRRRRRGPDA